MSEETIREDIRALAGNLASLWNGGRDVLDEVVAQAGDRRMSPWGAIHRLGPDGIDRVFANDAARMAVKEAFGGLTRYLAAPTWFDRASREDDRLKSLAEHPVAYFCAEYGLVSWLPIYSGGLGVLAGDMLKEASDMGLPLVAVGLFYRCGFFYQQLDSSDYQTELTPDLDPNDLPMQPAVYALGKDVVVGAPMGERTVYARVWKVQVGRVPLFLLILTGPENERTEDREITKSLYGGDQDTRIRQELIWAWAVSARSTRLASPRACTA